MENRIGELAVVLLSAAVVFAQPAPPPQQAKQGQAGRGPQGPPVVPRGRDDHLSHTALQRPDDRPVEEGGARREVSDHLARADGRGARDVAGQPLVGRGVTVRCRQALEGQPVGRDPLRCDRRLSSPHWNRRGRN